MAKKTTKKQLYINTHKVTTREKKNGETTYYTVINIDGHAKRFSDSSYEGLTLQVLNCEGSKRKSYAQKQLVARMPLATAYEMYLKDYECAHPKSFNTVRNKKTLFNYLDYFENCSLEKLTESKIIRWQEYLSEDMKLKESTAKEKTSYLTNFLKWCMDRGYYTENIVFSNLRKFKAQKNNFYEKGHHYTVNEFKQYVKYYDEEQYKIMANLLFKAGLRIGEGCAITYDDIIVTDLEDGNKNYEVFINKQVIYKKEKGKPGEYNYEADLKHGGYHDKTRYVNIDEKLYNDLMSLKNRKNQKRVFSDTMRTDMPKAYDRAERRFNKDKESGLDRFLSLHKLRHSFCIYELYEGKMDETTVAKLMGHSNTNMIHQHYLHAPNDSKSKGVPIVVD